jgi:hypothetical protein
MAGQPVGISLQDGLDHADAVGGALIAESQEENPVEGHPAAEDQVAEVLVVGHEDPLLAHGASQDIRVIRFGHYVGDRHGIMPKAAEILRNACASGFVDDELHGGA